MPKLIVHEVTLRVDASSVRIIGGDVEASTRVTISGESMSGRVEISGESSRVAISDDAGASPAISGESSARVYIEGEVIE